MEEIESAFWQQTEVGRPGGSGGVPQGRQERQAVAGLFVCVVLHLPGICSSWHLQWGQETLDQLANRPFNPADGAAQALHKTRYASRCMQGRGVGGPAWHPVVVGATSISQGVAVLAGLPCLLRLG